MMLDLASKDVVASGRILFTSQSHRSNSPNGRRMVT